MKRIKIEDYLKEVCSKTTENNQYPVLTSSQNGIVPQNEYFNKQIASKDNIGYKIIKKGQFTYRAMSDTGRFYINQLNDYDIGIVSPAYPVFEVPQNDDIIPGYLQKFFDSNKFQNLIAFESTGSTRVSLKLNKIKKITIDVPNIDEQVKIVNIIDKNKQLIEIKKNELKQIDELIKSQFVNHLIYGGVVC